MTQQPLTATAVKNMRLRIGAHNYELHANNVQWTPNITRTRWQGGTPEAIVLESNVDGWEAALTVAHDYQNPDSLYNFLLQHAGESAEIEWRPDPTGPFVTEATIVLEPPAIGGAARNVHESTVTCLSSAPVTVTTPATAPVMGSATPATGPTAGGTLVAITGSNLLGVTAVKFGTVNATEFSIVSSGLIYAVAPAQAAGSKPVSLVNAAGTSGTAPFSYA